MTLPTFIIVGANKAGTTALYATLKQHPDVFMSPVKEPSYFIFSANNQAAPTVWPWDDPWIGTFDAYSGLFAGVRNERAVGEASTGYLSNPGAAKAIATTLPSVRVIAILRDPIDRAVSMHAAWTLLGLEDLSFPDAIAAEDAGRLTPQGERRRYVKLGYYGDQLQHYYDLFPPEHIRVYLYDDWRDSPMQVLRDLLAFIGVDNTWQPASIPRNNTRAEIAGRVLGSDQEAKDSQNGLRTIDRVNSDQDELRCRDQLRLRYHKDLVLAGKLLGRDLTMWMGGFKP